MIDKTSKELQQRLKPILQANQIFTEWSLLYTNKLLEFSFNQEYNQNSNSNNGLLDIAKLTFHEQYSNPFNFNPLSQKQQQFFSSIPNALIDESTEQRIMNFKCNFVSSKRKDELFKRQKKQQQEKLNARKKQIQKYYYNLNNVGGIMGSNGIGNNGSNYYGNSRFDIQRGLKGQFMLKRGDQQHTCSITSDDLEKLKPQTDLNDTIIGNYLKYIQTEVLSEKVQKTIFIYSSFFFEKLVGDIFREEPPMFNNQKEHKYFTEKIRAKVQENYKNIQRWTRRVDIFEKEYLIVPINAFKHWYCVIIGNPGGLLNNKTTASTKNGKQPCIIYCDSMFQKRFYIIDAIRMYLEIALQDKKTTKISIDEDNLPCYQLLLPRQTNTHDCGLYMLTYIQNLLSNPHQLEHLDQIKNREKLSIFPRSLIYSMRQRLKQLFIKLIQNTDEGDRKQIMKKYKQQTERIIKEVEIEKDIDKINIKEFKKYESINSHLLENTNGGDLSEEELQFACKIKFYLDPQVNFYERDRFL